MRDLERAIELWRRLAEADPEGFAVRLARSLHAESVWLGADGLPDEAMRLSVEAVTLLRARAAHGAHDADEDLARALNGLGAALVAMGRPAEAVGPVAEAVALRRSTIEDAAPRRTMEFATTLVHLGRTLCAAGRHREALPALQEAERFFRDAATNDPEGSGPAHAGVVETIGLAHAAVGDGDAAVRCLGEAVDIRSAHGRTPGSHPALADTLQHLARALGRAGRLVDGSAAADESVRIGRPGRAPVPAERRTTFVDVLLTAAEAARIIGRTETAVRHASDALALLGRAVDGRIVVAFGGGDVDEETAPGQRVHAFDVLATALADSGRDIESLRAADACASELRSLGDRMPGAVPGLDDTALALALHLQSTRLGAVGRCLEAMARSAEAVNLLRAAVAGRSSARAHLATVLADHGVRTGEAGHLAQALEPVDEALDLLRDAPGTTPGETLASVHVVRAERLGALGRNEEALVDIDHALRLLREAPRAEALRPRVLLARALERRATLLRETGRSGEAEVADAQAANVDTSVASPR